MRIWLSAGEVSGDALGAHLADALRRVRPDVWLAGIAGPSMRATGLEPCLDASRFSHAGWSSVVRNLPALALDVRRAGKAMDAFAPDLVVAIDAPGLNRILLRRALSSGMRVAWLAPPQLWAWRKRVVPELDGMDVYPLHSFEVEALAKAGARPRWYGYPGTRPGREKSPDGRLLVLLPGTRPAWRARHEGLFREAARCSGLDLDAVVAVPAGHPPGSGEMPVEQAFESAALCLAMPGTGVLEACSRGIPTVVAASPGRLDLWLARRRVAPGPLSLPNRILGGPELPELLEGPGPEELGAALRTLWQRREELSALGTLLRERMGEAGAMDRIALDLLGL
jgi:lipid-A-disaccharide synthase